MPPRPKTVAPAVVPTHSYAKRKLPRLGGLHPSRPRYAGMGSAETEAGQVWAQAGRRGERRRVPLAAFDPRSRRL
jgi:hypothetical protein